MNEETKRDDLSVLMKEHVRLMAWLVRLVAFQAAFIIALICAILWMILPEIVRPSLMMY